MAATSDSPSTLDVDSNMISRPNWTHHFERCNTTVPSARELFLHMSTTYLILYSAAIALTVALTILWTVEIYYIFKYVSKKSQRSGKFIWMTGMQPVTAIGAIIAVCVPRSMKVVGMFTLLYFARCLFMVIELVVDYFGGRVKMAYALRNTRMRLNTLPLCCCLVCLPQAKASVPNIRHIEWLVYQASIIRPITFLISEIMLADMLKPVADRTAAFIIIDTINILSTIVAIYGVILFARNTSEALKAYHASVLLRLAQMVIVIYNIQKAIFDALVRNRVITCDELLPAQTKADIWHCLLLVLECSLLASAAAYFLRPSVNATFDRHPRHRWNKGDAALGPHPDPDPETAVLKAEPVILEEK